MGGRRMVFIYLYNFIIYSLLIGRGVTNRDLITVYEGITGRI